MSLREIKMVAKKSAVKLVLEQIPLEQDELNARLQNYIINVRPVQYAKAHPAPKQDKDNIRASTLSRICLRESVFSISNPKEFLLSSMKSMLVGDILHDFIQKELYPQSKDSHGEWIIRHEAPFELDIDGIAVRGHADIVHYLNGWLREIKTTKWLSYSRKEADLAYVRQIHIYMKGLEVYEAYIPYVQKDNLDINSWKIGFSDELWDVIVDDAKTIRDCLISGEPAPKNINKFCKTRSSQCRYYDECQAID